MFSFYGSTILITITHAPVVNAGADIDVCLAGNNTVTGASKQLQHTIMVKVAAGTGNFINPTSLVTTYNPSAADLAAGSVVLTLTATGNSPCVNSASDALIMFFHPYVTVNAGADATICEGSNFTVARSSTANQSSVVWSTLGSGSFVGGNTLTPTYFPSAADIIFPGNVTLIITALPVAPCTVTVSDTMILTITAAPTVNAGADVTLCERAVIVTTLDAIATNYSTLLWSSTGTGSFSSTSALHPNLHSISK